MKTKKSDVPAKIVTLIIAIFLWSYVMSSTNPIMETEYRNINVNYTNAAELDRQGLVIMGPDEVKVNVRLKGNKTDLDKFIKSGTGSIFAQVDLSGYSEGKVKVPITVGFLDQANGVSILSYEPKEVLFDFEKIVTKEIPIQMILAGKLAEGYVTGDMVLKPQKVMVSGPRTWINEVEKAVGIIDVTGLEKDINVTLPVKIVDSFDEEVRGVNKEQELVDVILPVFNTKLVAIELLTTNELPENYAITGIEIKPSNIVLKGKDLTNISKIYTTEVDLSTLIDKEFIDLELQLPDGVTFKDEKQKIVLNYKVEQIIDKAISFTGEKIEVLNLDKSLKLDESYLEQIYITNISGFKSKVDTIEIGGLKAKIDLKDLGVGEHQVPIIWDQSLDFEIKSVNPEIVRIKILER